MSTSPGRDSEGRNTSYKSSSPENHQLTVPGKPENGRATPKRRRGLCQASRTPATPDSYVQRKFAILIVLALGVWSFYVVVGRVCTPIIRNRSSSGLGRSVGVGTLIGFIPLWLLFAWSYLKMILTGPGFAAKILPKSAPPINPPSTDYLPYRPPDFMQNGNSYPVDDNPAAPNPSEITPIANAVMTSATRSPAAAIGTASVKDVPRPIPHVEIAPRWCRFCEIIKPDRTHHCRHCGTCVMQFDHHCLWIGQCVGWANHKFFISFNFWTSIYCLYVMIFLIVFATKSSTPDGQVIGLIAVAALFGLFTWSMLVTHIHFILTGRTTVESYRGHDQREREAAVLQKEFGYLWRNLEKRQVRRTWMEEWGGSPVDARWRHGSLRQMWEQEMGKVPLGWFLPIGRPLGDGMHFPSNPRFGPNGEWLRKRDWPKDVV